MAPGFSYAQAIKGRAPVPSATPTSTQQDQVGDESSQPTLVESEPKAVVEAVQVEEDRTDEQKTVSTEDSSVPNKPATAKSQSVSEASAVTSPSLTESAATLGKDDEAANIANDSEGTNWEKVSQTSQSGEKSTAKSTGGSDDSKTTESWEEVKSQAPVLKEAPLPSVNAWLKRAQDAQAKGKPAPTSTESSLSVSAMSSDGPTPRKKGRQSMSEAGGVKSGVKTSKSEEGPVRRYKPSSETRLASRLPPPASDAVSWPTPDLAKSDDKDKTKVAIQEQGENNDQDKEKTTGTKRGKKQWEQIEFVPTAVFNTPLPTSRRGGRPSGRGGREPGNHRGASNPSGNDRTSEGNSRAGSSEAPVDRNRNEGGAGRPGHGAPRQKRPSTAGQTRPRDFRKNEEGGRNDLSKSSGAEVTSANDSSSQSLSTNENGVASSNAGDLPTVNGSPLGEAPPSVEGRTPRQFREGRGDYTGQGRDFHRDANGAPRESRGERGGRGGHRGRGGHNYQFGTHSPGNGSNYSAGAPYGGQRSYGHDRQGQYPGFQSNREGRHYRSGSRSQASGGPGGRYAPGFNMPPVPGMPPAAEGPNGFGFPPAIQQPQFYHPGMDQAPLLGILIEQLRYYFSLDNLVRDTYLRSRMDDQGFIPLTFMMPWKRMALITQDISLVRFACQHVPEIELRLDVNGLDFVRPAKEWQKWVFKREDRLEEGRNDGPQLQPSVPVQHQYPPPPAPFASQIPPVYTQQGFPPRNGPTKGMNGSPGHQTTGSNTPQMNGHSDGSPTRTPLSATVAEFQPVGVHNLPFINGHDASAALHIQNLAAMNSTSEDSKALPNGNHPDTAPAVTPATEKTNGPIVASADAE